MISIKFLLWNIYNKNFIDVLTEVIMENEIDVIAMIECEKLDVQALLNLLHRQHYEMRLVEIYPDNSNIKLLAKNPIKITPKKESDHFSVYKIWYGGDLLLLSILHLCNGMYKEESARNFRASLICQQIEKIEDEVYGERERKGLVIGDFNLQPYSYGIAGVLSFNATMSIEKAKKVYRKIGVEKRRFYYNPVWDLMGKNNLVQGSYYNDSDGQDKSIFWYAYDEVLLRPYLIDRFNWDNFKYITKTKNRSFLIRKSIDKKKYSDHLPLKFEII